LVVRIKAHSKEQVPGFAFELVDQLRHIVVRKPQLWADLPRLEAVLEVHLQGEPPLLLLLLLPSSWLLLRKCGRSSQDLLALYDEPDFARDSVLELRVGRTEEWQVHD
jgi:hypothetical protein